MDFQLVRHPLSPMPPIDGISVSVSRLSDVRLGLQYRLTGDISAISMPLVMANERADDLWKTTCFEAFVKQPGGQYYSEFNFSPSTRWAAYVFDDYREGMRDIPAATVPRFDMRAGTDSFELGVVVDLMGTEEAWRSSDLALNLCAVIETRDRQRSYWALAHPPEKPDFHDGDCFIGILQAPGAA